jgi:hypothetical protein
VAVGRLLKLPAVVEQALIHDNRSPHIYLIATHNGRNYYRVGDSGRCYGAAPASNLVHPPTFPRDPAGALGGFGCNEQSKAIEVWDLSTWGPSAANPAFHLRGLLGIASKAVRSIALLSATGTVEASVPVVHNLYWDGNLPTGIVEVQALGASGKVLWDRTARP